MTSSRLTRWLVTALAAFSFTISPVIVEAQGRTSGGYSRPGPSRQYTAPSRTPPIGSGGYNRPSLGAPTRTPPIGIPRTGSDRAISRQSSGNALDTYRREQEIRTRPAPSREYNVPRPQPRDWTTTTVPPSRTGGLRQRYDDSSPIVLPRIPSGRTYQPTYRRNPNWSIPPYAQTGQSYGSWNPFMLWFLFETLSRPGHSDWFHHHRNDPGYSQWRQEADRQAQSNPELKGKLDELDRNLAEKSGQPTDPSYLPPDISREEAITQAAPASSGLGLGRALLWIIVLSLIFGFGFMFVTRFLRRSGRLSPKGNGMSKFDVAKAVIASKTGLGDAPAAQVGPKFRVGQVLTIDPTPFLTAVNSRVTPPGEIGAETTMSVVAVGEIDRPIRLTRLHVADGQFFQIHVNDTGEIEDCRYFSRFDEVMPADSSEWDFWLSPTEGMIGYPIFETKDGLPHTRLWKPGSDQTSPITMTEVQTTNAGTRRLEHTAMLYKRNDTAQAEYLLVEVEQDETRNASVVIYTGLDIAPASLGL